MSDGSGELRMLKRAIGKGKELGVSILEAIEDAGGTGADVKRILSDPELRRHIGRTVVASGLRRYDVMLNDYQLFDLDWSELQRRGDFGTVNPRIVQGDYASARQPETVEPPEHPIQVALFPTTRRIRYYWDLVADIAQHGFCLAGLPELVQSACQHWEELLPYKRIVAPSSISEFNGDELAVLARNDFQFGRDDPATGKPRLVTFDLDIEPFTQFRKGDIVLVCCP